MSQWALSGKNRLERKKKRQSEVLSTFFIEVTSNLHEVSMPLGNTKEAIPFKRDSLNHIPTHFVIRLDSKSILKPGPLDSSNPRSSSLNIPAHMNHSKSWLPEGISCPALSLSFSLSDCAAESWAGTRRALIWTQRERRRRARLNRALALGLLRERERHGDSGCAARCLHTQTRI